MNEAFLEILFNQYRDKIIGFFVQFIGDQEQAKDLMQDVFLKLLNSKSDLEQVVDMDGYIYQMCRNRAYDHLKKAYRDKNYKEYLFNKLNFSSQQVSPEAEQQMDIEHYHEILEQSLRKLPNQQRLIFILSKKEGLSHQKIAEQLNLSPITVRNHLHRAMKQLRATTNPDIDLVLMMIGLMTPMVWAG